MQDVIATDTTAAEISGLQEVASYTIQADAKMFRILIGALYSDKPRAIVRELCCNALDSHAQAGILDRPFKLQLPTRWDDTFSVRDYGVSLTHHQVMNLYTTVGASTKGGENTTVGKFGLGCKTPFAYTDSFTVTAILDGEKRIYNAFMDAGTPKIALLVTEPTDEEQGLEVTFAVAMQDHSAFVSAARRVLLGFDVLPVNNIELSKVSFDVLSEGDGWKIVKRDYAHALTGPTVRQGCIFYPIDVAALRAVRNCDALTALTDEVLILDMPIGTVDITPSRESLSYDPVTAKNILNRCEDVYTHILTKFESSVKGAPSLFTAIQAKKKVLSGIHNTALRSAVSARLTWRNKEVPAQITFSQQRLHRLYHHGVDLSRVSLSYGSGRRRWKITGAEPASGSFPFDPTDDKIVFVYVSGDVTPKHLKHRLFAAHNLASSVFLLRRFTPGSKAEAYLRAAFGRPGNGLIEFVDLLTLPYVKPDSSKKRARVQELDVLHREFKTVDEDDVEGSIYFVRSYSRSVMNGNREVSLDSLIRLLRVLKEQDLIESDANIVNIPASRKDLATNVPEDWSDFFEHARRKIALNFDGSKAMKAHAFDAFRTRLSSNQRWVDLVDTFGRVSGWETNTGALADAVRVVAGHKKAIRLNAADDAMKGIIPLVFNHEDVKELLPSGDDADTSELEEAKARFRDAYPLIARHAGNYGSTEEYAEWIDYANMRDRSEGENRSYAAFSY